MNALVAQAARAVDPLAVVLFGAFLLALAAGFAAYAGACWLDRRYFLKDSK